MENKSSKMKRLHAHMKKEIKRGSYFAEQMKGGVVMGQKKHPARDKSKEDFIGVDRTVWCHCTEDTQMEKLGQMGS